MQSSLDPTEAKKVCKDCKDYRRNQPVIGMVIMRDMRRAGDDEYTGGDILDPDTGASIVASSGWKTMARS